MKLDGKVVLITGGGSGIGAACAWHMASEGAAIAVTGVPADRVSQVATALQSAGHQALARPTDVRHEEQIETAVTATVEAFGRLDVVVASATIQLHDRGVTRAGRRGLGRDARRQLSWCVSHLQARPAADGVAGRWGQHRQHRLGDGSRRGFGQCFVPDGQTRLARSQPTHRHSLCRARYPLQRALPWRA